jgi:hypothetical protein
LNAPFSRGRRVDLIAPHTSVGRRTDAQFQQEESQQ